MIKDHESGVQVTAVKAFVALGIIGMIALIVVPMIEVAFR